MMKTKILVADGCEFVARTVSQLATRFGYEVTACVTSGAEALEAARRDPPDLALVDLHMGGDVAGTDVAGHFVSLGRPVVFLSALPTDRSVAIAEEFGASGILPKPFGTSEFRREVVAALSPVRLVTGTAGR